MFWFRFSREGLLLCFTGCFAEEVHAKQGLNKKNDRMLIDLEKYYVYIIPAFRSLKPESLNSSKSYSEVRSIMH